MTRRGGGCCVDRVITFAEELAGCSCGGGGSGLRFPAGPVTEGLIIVVICWAMEEGAGGA